jgi:putative membrane protein (TIGR04086 family)
LIHTAKDGVGPALQHNTLFRFGELFIGLGCSLIGGFAAGRIAGREHLLHGVFSSYLCVLLGIVSIAARLDSNPWWQETLMMFASTLCSLLGGYLSRTEAKTEVGVPI